MTSQYQLPGPGGPDSAESKSPSEWLLLLFWRQKWVLVAALAVAGLGVFAYLRVATPLYTSTARVYVRPAGTVALSSNQTGGGAANPLTFTNTQMEVIKGETVLSIAGALMAGSADRKAAPADQALDLPTTTKRLQDVVDTAMDRNTDIIYVTAKHPRAEGAKAIADAVVNAYIKYSSKPKDFSNVPEMLQRYETEYATADAELKKRQAELQGLEADYGPVVRPDERNSLEERRLDALQQQLSAAQQELIAADDAAVNARRQLERLVGARPASQKADPLDDELELGAGSVQEQQALRLEILQVQAQLQELQQKYGVEHPSVKTLRQRLGRLNRVYLLSIEQRAVTLRRQAERLKAEVATARTELAKYDSHAAKYKEIRGEVDRLRGIRDTFDAKVRQIKLERDTGGVTIDVIDAPKAADRPSLPEKPKVAVIGIALGLVLGMVLAALREWLDDRMRSAGEIKTSLGMPLLAVVPQSSTKRSFSVQGQRVLLDPSSDAAEAYRSLRTAVQFAAPEGLKTLLVASPNSGDGKTTLVTNLGIAMAQAGRRVCVVDADLRKPTIHDIFGLKTTLGLTTLLAGRSTLEGTVQRGAVAGLDVLPCGPVPANPAEVLNSQEFGNVLDLLADRYDIVLLDSPPVQSAADARMIAASCDATLIVLTAQSAHRRTTEATRDALQSVGARIIGLVVNDVPRRGGPGYGTPRAMRQLVPGLTNQEFDILQARAK
ncbi:MAG: capsular exopolysaccharide family protein [Phycisphaerales bacterium]|nr:capsular exopolysaccharide family protein [Phycisphaerales bacterium]